MVKSPAFSPLAGGVVTLSWTSEIGVNILVMKMSMTAKFGG
ncbi:MAG: hypothetical protein Q4B79_05445 [Moraxella sp.]|nr:hypothetical protein [Moraxella sp.]MDO4450387.1 hypothetical protein [Moraxella sp.]